MKLSLPQRIILLLLTTLGMIGLTPHIHAIADLDPRPARMRFSPTSVNVANGGQATMNVTIDVSRESAFSADAIITYTGADLDVVSVANGGFFPSFTYANNPNGRIEIHANTSITGRSGSGILATITFRAKQSSGASALSFVCGEANSTQIISPLGGNILSCANINQAVIGFIPSTATPTQTPTATPTVTPTETPIPTATPTPVPGATAPTCIGLSVSPQTITVNGAVKLTCTGEIAGTDITAAEFSFGDGQTQLVEQNVGTKGSIFLSHQYTTTGIYGAWCRVRDNNNRFSTVPDSCKKDVSVQAYGVTSAPTPTRQPGTTATPTGTDEIDTTISPTPTVSIDDILGSPTPSISPDTTTSSNILQTYGPLILFGIIAAILIAIALYLLR